MKQTKLSEVEFSVGELFLRAAVIVTNLEADSRTVAPLIGEWWSNGSKREARSQEGKEYGNLGQTIKIQM